MREVKKVIVIGLDGATWDVLMPLVEKNKLPTFKKLMEHGAWGILKSTVPPVTGPSWLVFATSKNPGKLGVYDFFIRDEDDLRLKPIYSKYYKGHSIWDYLGRKGYKVGIVAFPNLYPPYAVNGFMVSGMGAFTDKITYPEELKEEIDEISGGFELVVNCHEPKYDNMDLFLRDLNRLTDKQYKVALNLLKTKEWDFFIYVLSGTDWIQHIMWKHVDKSHPSYDKRNSPKYAKEFEKYFHKLDAFLEKVINQDANILIVSDHGFGPQYQVFNMVKWLENKGYLVRRPVKKGLIEKIMIKLRELLFYDTRFQKFWKYIPNLLANQIDKRLEVQYNIADFIDYDKSVAYCLGHTLCFSGIYINPKIENSDEYKKIKKDIINDLKNLSNDIGKSVEVTVYESEDIYKGDKVKLAPHIIPSINDYGCLILESSFERPLFEDKPYSRRMTGFHKLEGVIIAYGKDIKKGYKMENSKIYDVTPTILHIFGLPISDDMDGKVLMDIFKPDSEPATRKAVYVDSSYYGKTKEEEKVRAKIKKLKLEGKI